MNSYNEVRKIMLQYITSETTEEYKFKKAIVEKTIRNSKGWAEKEILEDLEKDYNNPRNF